MLPELDSILATNLNYDGFDFVSSEAKRCANYKNLRSNGRALLGVPSPQILYYLSIVTAEHTSEVRGKRLINESTRLTAVFQLSRVLKQKIA